MALSNKMNTENDRFLPLEALQCENCCTYFDGESV